jgi:hypothetical protein
MQRLSNGGWAVPGHRVTASDNKTYDISLTGTCLKCHPNKVEFCDRCHNYNAVAPN